MSQDEAATFIQTRARGMIDRKKVKEKRRRHRGGKKNTPKPAAQPAANKPASAQVTAGTGKERAFFKQNIAPKQPGSSLEIPVGGGGLDAGGVEGIKVFDSLGGNRYAEPLRGPVEEFSSAPAARGQPVEDRAVAPAPQLPPDMLQGMMMQMEAISGEKQELELKVKELSKQLVEAQTRSAELEATVANVASGLDKLVTELQQALGANKQLEDDIKDATTKLREELENAKTALKSFEEQNAAPALVKPAVRIEVVKEKEVLRNDDSKWLALETEFKLTVSRLSDELMLALDNNQKVEAHLKEATGRCAAISGLGTW
jgi:hypothetical protein